MEHVDLDVATEFLLIAATLVELKARRLLPGREDVDLDEELMRFEERDLLLARLLECKTFQDAARVMSEQLQSREPFGRAHRRARGAVPVAGARSARAGCARRAARGGAARAHAQGRRGSPDRAHRADPGERPRRDRHRARAAARTGRDALPRAHLRRVGEARDHRAVPRRARAVQARCGRSRTGRELRRPHGAPARRGGAGRARPLVARRVGRRRTGATRVELEDERVQEQV